MDSFTLSDYEARNNLVRLDGKKIVLPKRTCLARHIRDHRNPSAARLVRITRTDKRGSEWEVHANLGRFYLAGPMRGLPLFNFPAFLMAASILRARGLKILSPADKDMEAGFDPSQPNADFDIGAAFRWDFEAVCQTHGTILLPGWENSTGAKAERVVAQLCEREVYVLDANHVLTEAPEATYDLTWTPKPLPGSIEAGAPCRPRA
jgi:hypothetical protein